MANHVNTVSSIVPQVSITRSNTVSCTTSTSVTIGGTSEILEISAINDGVFFLVGAGTVTTSTSGFTGYVQSGMTRHYNIPIGTTSIQIISTSGSCIIITY